MDNKQQTLLTLRVSKPSGEELTLPLSIISTEVLQGSGWKPSPSLALSYEAAAQIVAFTGDDLSTEEFIQEIIPYSFVEGQSVADDVAGLENDQVLWSWAILLNGQAASYAHVNDAAQAVLSQTPVNWEARS